MSKLVCQACGTAVPYDEPIPRDAECEKCRRDLRCCRNCRHWDPRMNNECRETEAERIAEKTRRNFCEFFEFSREPFKAADAGPTRADEARRRLDELFRKKGPEPDPE